MQAELKRNARALLLHSHAMSECEPASEKLAPPALIGAPVDVMRRRTARCGAPIAMNSTMTTMPQS